jgi:hypothetical protein
MSLIDRDYYKKKHSLKFNESKGEIILDDVNTKNIKNDNSLTNKNEKIKGFEHEVNFPEFNIPKKPFSFFPWIVALLLILAVSKAIYKNFDIEQPIKKSDTIVPSEILPVPPTSILFAGYNMSSSTSPLTLQADNKNYYVKLCDSANANKTIGIFFVRAGEVLSTKVPFGQFAIKYASGSEWQGENKLFGQFSQCGKSQTLTFYSDGFTSQGHMISFNKVSNGNFQTNAVGRDYILQN